jgi:hypothetical protein
VILQILLKTTQTWSIIWVRVNKTKFESREKRDENSSLDCLSAFRDRGVLKPTSECAACPSQMGRARGRARRGERRGGRSRA